MQSILLFKTLVNSAQYHRYAVVSSPSDALALSNCLIVHPSDFSSGQHVFVKQQYPLTTRYAS